MTYQLAIFDLDGTILDTIEDLAAGVNHGLLQSGFPCRTVEEIRRFVGNGIRRTIEQAVPPRTDAAAIERVYADFSAYYPAHCAERTRPYPGLPALMERLRRAGIAAAVVTNKSQNSAQILCDAFYPGVFTPVIGEQPGRPRKPDPSGVRSVLDTLSIPQQQAVYIGDSDVDIATAHHAGLPCIGVSWGFRGRAFLEAHGADFIADTADELAALLRP